MWGWIATGALAALGIVVIRQFRAAHGVYRPLASRQPQNQQTSKTPLGMEATDLDAVAKVMRRNESLERSGNFWNRKGPGLFTAKAETDIQPFDDDETYAKRYYTAFQKDQ